MDPSEALSITDRMNAARLQMKIMSMKEEVAKLELPDVVTEYIKALEEQICPPESDTKTKLAFLQQEVKMFREEVEETLNDFEARLRAMSASAPPPRQVGRHWVPPSEIDPALRFLDPPARFDPSQFDQLAGFDVSKSSQFDSPAVVDVSRPSRFDPSQFDVSPPPEPADGVRLVPLSHRPFMSAAMFDL